MTTLTKDEQREYEQALLDSIREWEETKCPNCGEVHDSCWHRLLCEVPSEEPDIFRKK